VDTIVTNLTTSAQKMDKIRLRNTLRKLRQIPFDRGDLANTAVAPQEMLDFLAMLAGLKPVFLLGRGFDDPRWIEGVSAIARRNNLPVISGPKWAAEPDHIGLPDWYDGIDPTRDKREQPVIYICKSRDTAAEVASICSSGSITMAQEARLLGYPNCCVIDQYRRNRLMNAGFYRMLQRTSGGNIHEMQRIVRERVQMRPETPEEIADIQAACYRVPAPFTSFYMCGACNADLQRPARRISAVFKSLAETIDSALAEEIHSFG
jgi:hypothetical protein